SFRLSPLVTKRHRGLPIFAGRQSSRRRAWRARRRLGAPGGSFSPGRCCWGNPSRRGCAHLFTRSEANRGAGILPANVQRQAGSLPHGLWAWLLLFVLGCRTPAARFAVTAPDNAWLPCSVVFANQIVEDSAVEITCHPLRTSATIAMQSATGLW